jgi:HK97 family phage portal protein
MPSWRFWRRSPTNEYRPLSDPFIAAMLGGGSSSVAAVGESTALSLSAVYRAVSIGAGSMGSLPLRTLKTTRDGMRERSTSFLDDPGFGQWTPYEWKELAATHLWLHGNAYGQHVYNGAGALVGLNWIHPLGVQVEADGDALGGRRYTVDLGGGDRREFDAGTLTHVMGLSLDGLKGLSPISLARLSLSTGLSGDRAAHQMQTNGAMLAGLVTPDADEDLTVDEAKTVKETVTAAMTGVENAGAVAVINRKLKFTPWQLSAVDAQFMASRDFSIDEVGRWWGIPGHLLGQTEKQTSWGTGIAEQNRGLARWTLTPWTSRFEQRMTRLLAGSASPSSTTPRSSRRRRRTRSGSCSSS